MISFCNVCVWWCVWGLQCAREKLAMSSWRLQCVCVCLCVCDDWRTRCGFVMRVCVIACVIVCAQGLRCAGVLLCALRVWSTWCLFVMRVCVTVCAGVCDCVCGVRHECMRAAMCVCVTGHLWGLKYMSVSRVCVCVWLCVYKKWSIIVWSRITMGWLQRVGSLKLYVSFAKEPHKRDVILQKRPMILSLITHYYGEATMSRLLKMIGFLQKIVCFIGLFCKRDL